MMHLQQVVEQLSSRRQKPRAEGWRLKEKLLTVVNPAVNIFDSTRTANMAVNGALEKMALHDKSHNDPLPRIKTLEWFRVKPRWLFVKITDDSGGYGWGEATLEGHDKAVEGALSEMADRLIGYVAEYAKARLVVKPADVN